MEKRIEIYPAYDKRHPDPKKNYGIGGVKMFFILKGEKGAVTFTVDTAWQLPEVQKELWTSFNPEHTFLYEPRGNAVSYHSLTPVWGHEHKYDKPCNALGSDYCYGDSTFLCDDYLDTLIREGTEGLWKMLEEFYNTHLTK